MARTSSESQVPRVVKFVMFEPKDWILCRISSMLRISFRIYGLQNVVNSRTQLSLRIGRVAGFGRFNLRFSPTCWALRNLQV